MLLAVPSKAQRNLTIAQNMEQRLPMILTEGTVVPGLLPQVEVGVYREFVDRGIQANLKGSGGKPSTAFNHITGDVSSHNLAISPL